MEEKFTEILFELIVEKNISLKESLILISEKNNGIIGKTCSYLLDSILQGINLSSAMRKNKYMSFDDIYITFINYGEKTGNIKETISFLYKRGKRKQENLFRVFEASVYPFFVILTTIIMCIYLKIQNIFSFGMKFYFFLILIILLCLILFYFIRKLIGENKIYEAFLGIGFLLKDGINLYDAIICGARIVGLTTKEGNLFLKAGEKLLFGMDLQKSFSFIKKYSNAFYYASKSGGNIDIFEKIAIWIGNEDEKKRKICFSLIEPIFIMVTGLFLIIIVSNLFLPYLTNLSCI